MTNKSHHLSSSATWRYLWLLFIFVVCVLVFRFSYLERLVALQQPYEIKQNVITDQAALLINGRLSLVETQIKLFRHELELLNPDKAELQQAMVSMFDLYLDLLQIRWIDLNGQERVRLNRSKSTKITVVPPEGLQNKADRYYIQAAKNLGEEEIFVSRIDLNVEQGKVQDPLKPTIRAVMQAKLPQIGSGYLVINFDLNSLLKQLATLNQPNIQLLVAAGEERWILHPDQTRQWTKDLATTRSDIRSDLPNLLALIKQQKVVQGTALNNHLYSALSIPSDTEQIGGLQSLYVLTQTTAALLPALKRQAFLFAALTSLATGLVGLVLLMLYARHLKQVRRLGQSLQQERDNLQNALERQSSLINQLAEAKKLSSLSVMVAGLAHELNTPVGATQLALSNHASLLDRLIKNIHEGLTKSALDSFVDQSQKSLHQAQHNNQRAIELIQGFKRLTFERATEELNTFNVAERINDLCLSMQGLMNKKNIYVNANIPADICLTGYAGAFSQTVQTILSNAIEHAFDNLAGARIELACEENEESVILTISDNGKGITEQELPHIFEPFVTSKRHQQHIGLGLHMARVWMQEAFVGHIDVSSKCNMGTTFTLTFRQLRKQHDEIASSNLSHSPFM